jgi:putative DNA primase/helicase
MSLLETRKGGPLPEAAPITETRGQTTDSNDRLQSLISVFADANGKEPDGSMTVAEFIAENINDGDHVALVKKIRQAVENFASKVEIDAMKKRLPAVSLSGRVTHGGRGRAFQEGRFEHSGWLQIDLDGKDFHPRTPEDVRAEVGNDPHVALAMLSPTVTGVKAICRIPICQTPEKHLAAFYAAEAYFRVTYGLKIDDKTKDPVRMFFASHDPDAVTKNDVVEMPVPATQDALPPAVSQPRGTKRESGGLVISEHSKEWTLDDLAEMIKQIPRPAYDEWLAICSGVWNHFGESATPTLAAHWPEESPGEYAEKFKHRTQDHTLGTVVHHAKEHGWQGSPAAIRATAARLRETPLPANLPDLTCFGESDADNALRVHAVAGGNFHFVSETGQWLVWDGCRWTPDKDGKMVRLFLNVMDGTARQGLAAGKGGESLVKFSMRCRDSAKVASGLAMLKSVQGVTISANDLDADPWILGTPTGMIDLKTGRAIEPDKRLLVTKSIACDLDPGATCPIWERVIHTATAGDVELIRFLKAWTGYTLTGSVKEECLAFLHGTGANGKGTFTECMRALMSDYALTAPESLFTADRNSSATNDIARLAGCRMACAAELDENASFAESRLKAITGRDAITARFLHREFFDFQPTHKLWISGNHKPSVRGVDHGIWRRIRLIPFTVTIPKEERDLDLAEKLRNELPGILNWAIEGCLDWQREGLKTPQCVANATAAYQAAEDVVGQFLDDVTETDTKQRTLQSSLFEAYSVWAEKQGIREAMSANMLNRKLEERGFRKIKVNGSRFWGDIALK